MIDFRKVWKKRKEIWEGWFYYLFPFLERRKNRKYRDQIAAQRLKICVSCGTFHQTLGCEIPGTGPCCSLLMGGCGCSLKAKTRSLSSSCPKGKWFADMTDEEAYNFEKKLAE